VARESLHEAGVAVPTPVLAPHIGIDTVVKARDARFCQDRLCENLFDSHLQLHSCENQIFTAKAQRAQRNHDSFPCRREGSKGKATQSIYYNGGRNKPKAPKSLFSRTSQIDYGSRGREREEPSTMLKKYPCRLLKKGQMQGLRNPEGRGALCGTPQRRSGPLRRVRSNFGHAREMVSGPDNAGACLR